uniref:Bet v I/Major latex protein domain-containing protein n=1 Tax=Hemiselmis andersenii TaxID=464988 RepID=A0A7S1EDV1_HEMAN|mmetsp:Transcript_45907/g.111731  ORF Transcript_45907/g.111731 Transcript_45907/m.111731 type:complete len:145 (+) Transcript_45907:71-505(+)
MSSTRTFESSIINAPCPKVWSKIRSMDFAWWRLVKKTAVTTGASSCEVGSCHKIDYSDGSSWTVRLCELSDIDHFLTYEVIASTEALPVTSAVHTIRLRRITASSETMVEWETIFSNDAGNPVIEDSRFKKLEAFKDLAAACTA